MNSRHGPATQKPRATRSDAGTMRCAALDLELLRFVGEQYAVSLPQLARLMGCSPHAARWLRSRWERAGWASGRAMLVGEPVFVWLTRRGQTLAAIDCAVWRPNPGMLAHIAAVTDVRLVDVLVGILNGVVDDEEARLQAIAFVGPRASGHISSLATSLERSGASLSLRWRSGGRITRASCTANEATRLNAVLKAVVEEERDRVYRGRLVGSSLIRETFELELEDESVISGKVREGALDLLETFFGRDCTATVHIRETRLPSGETKEHVYLTALRP